MSGERRVTQSSGCFEWEVKFSCISTLRPQRPELLWSDHPWQSHLGARFTLGSLCGICFGMSTFKLSRGSWGEDLSFIIWMVEQTRIWAPTYLRFMRDQI